MSILNRVLNEIGSNINWDKYPANSESGREWKIADVLWSKVELLSSTLREYETKEKYGEFQELYNTLREVEEILEAIADDEETDYNISN